MGYMRHHAIIITASYDNIFKAREAAFYLNLDFSDIVSSSLNGYYSFFIAPDGSKEGWNESDDGDKKRNLFIKWLKSQNYEDGSSPYSWAEVQYGDENKKNKVTRWGG